MIKDGRKVRSPAVDSSFGAYITEATDVIVVI